MVHRVMTQLLMLDAASDCRVGQDFGRDHFASHCRLAGRAGRGTVVSSLPKDVNAKLPLLERRITRYPAVPLAHCVLISCLICVLFFKPLDVIGMIACAAGLKGQVRSGVTKALILCRLDL